MMNNVIDNIIGYANNQECKLEVLSIMTTGSQLFVSDPKDLDYVVVCGCLGKQFKRVKISNDDILFIDELFFHKVFDYLDTESAASYMRLYNYFYAINETLYGKVFRWDILSHEKEYIDFLSKHYEKNIERNPYKWKAGKTLVHYYIILKIYENKSLEITQEMKDNIAILYSAEEGCMDLVYYIADRLTPKMDE